MVLKPTKKWPVFKVKEREQRTGIHAEGVSRALMKLKEVVFACGKKGMSLLALAC